MMYLRGLRGNGLGGRGLGSFDVQACLDAGTDLQTCQGFAAQDAAAAKTGASSGAAASSADSGWVTAAKASGALLPGLFTALGIGPKPGPTGPMPVLVPPTPWYMTLPGLAIIGGVAFVGYKLFVK